MRRGFLLSSRSRAQEIRPGSVATPPNISVVNHASTNSTVAIPHLPPELSDRILDHLHDDLLTLNSCSRVCRAWLPRSRFHYFHAIELTSYAGARFADILTTNPHIGTLVHLVGIRILDRSDGDSNSLMRALPPIALRLPNVEKLTLHGDGEYTAPPFRNFTNVRELRIVGCEIPAFDDFIGIICFLPKLEILSCSRALIGLTSIVKRPSTELPRPRIKRLEFITTRIDPTEFTQWLIDEKMYDSIEEILLRPLHVLAMHPVGNFVSKVGPSLKEFDIALIETAILNSGMFGDLIGSQFSLAPCTNLRKLVLCSTKGFLIRSGSGNESFSWAATLLSQVHSSSVEEIIFFVSEGDLGYLRSKGWDSVMESLLGSRFASLKDVLVRIWGSDSTVDDVKAVMRTGLGSLEAKGVLRFEVHLATRYDIPIL